MESNEPRKYPLNAWYAAARSDEVTRNLFARELLGEQVVLYRREDGQPVALEDRCPHRFYPLSQGCLKGDRVVCGYHGLEIDPAGSCVRVPGQTGVPARAGIRSFPVIDRWQLVWIWGGDPKLADESLVPNLWRNEHPEWDLVIGDVLKVEADYRLLADNLLDTSHVTFLHKTTLGTPDVAEIPHETETFERSVRVSRWTLDRPAAPIFVKYGGFTGPVDRWQINTWTAPSLIEVDIGSCVAGTGAPQGNRSDGVEMLVYNLATPANDGAFHYFWYHTRKFARGDDEMSEVIRKQVGIALSEDIQAMQGVHAGLQRYRHLKPVDIRADGAGIRARRVVDQMTLDEQQSPSRAIKSE